MIDSNLFFDVERDALKKYPCCDVFLLIGGRSTGKTFSAKNTCWKHSIEDGIKLETAFLRRYDDDIEFMLSQAERSKLTANLEANKQYWRDHKLTIRGRYLCYKDSPICEFIPLEAAERIKSSDYAYIKYIIFEEFISDKGKYKKNEVKLFLSLISSLIRLRPYIKVIMNANSESIANPYCKALGITKMNKGQVIIKDNICVMYLYNKDLTREISKTKAAQIIRNFDPEYYAHAVENEFIGDNTENVYTLNESAHKVIQFNVRLTSQVVGIWKVNGLYYVGKPEKNTPIYCYRVSDAADNKGEFLNRKHIYWARIYKAYRDGTLGYADINIKNEVFELLQNTVPNFK